MNMNDTNIPNLRATRLFYVPVRKWYVMQSVNATSGCLSMKTIWFRNSPFSYKTVISSQIMQSRPFGNEHSLRTVCKVLQYRNPKQCFGRIYERGVPWDRIIIF